MLSLVVAGFLLLSLALWLLVSAAFPLPPFEFPEAMALAGIVVLVTLLALWRN